MVEELPVDSLIRLRVLCCDVILMKHERDRVHAVAQPSRGGPSLKTCPKCEPQREHEISLPKIAEIVLCSCTASWRIGCQKLGQPVPESNFESAL
jgi:hypothetical protein